MEVFTLNKKTSLEIPYKYIKEWITTYIDRYNVAESEKEKNEIWWELEPTLDFLKDAGLNVKIYENVEGDQLLPDFEMQEVASKDFIVNNIIKREELEETAYWQDKFFFVDLRTNKSGWAFIKQYKEDKNDSCKSVYVLTFFGGYRKADYGKTWVAFREEVDTELIRSQYKHVGFLKFI